MAEDEPRHESYMLIRSLSRETLHPILCSHGWASLAPFEVTDGGFRYPILVGPRTTVTVDVAGLGASIRVRVDRALSPRQEDQVKRAVRHMLSLDFPLDEFIGVCRSRRAKSLLRLARQGWGRMFRSPTFWEDAVKTLCTTNAVEREVRSWHGFGKSGETWRDGLNRRPQDYVVVPEQPWLDGYCVEKGVIRQFVAMPLGSGYTAEEQVTGAAEHGGLQILAYPMKREVYEQRFPKRSEEEPRAWRCMESVACAAPPAPDMGLAPGGRMEQEIFEDPYNVADWDLDSGSRCFIHIANSMVWRSITGENPPTTPPTAEEYTRAGLPWFKWYDDGNKALAGAGVLAGMKSIAQLGNEKGDVPLPENEPVTPAAIVKLRKGLKPGQVREWN